MGTDYNLPVIVGGGGRMESTLNALFVYAASLPF